MTNEISMTELMKGWEKAETPAIADALDRLGKSSQVLDPTVRALDGSGVLVGRARTMQFAPGETEQDYDELMERLTAFIESLQPGDVPVVACGWPNRYTIIGEIVATAAQMRGSPGWVTDGWIRDSQGIRGIGYQVFCSGFSPLSFIKRARIVSVDMPVVCAGAFVESNDIVVGDGDGCVAVPRSCSAEVQEMLRADVEADVVMRQALREGKSFAQVLAETH
ncbi:RraA family protein [Haliea sp.]